MRPEDAAEDGTVPGEGGMPKVVLRHASGSTADVYLHGAHVTSWRDAAGSERLFLSSRAVFSADAAIRGGIPISFPQFADQGPLPKHGFARTAHWTLVSTSNVSGDTGDGGSAEAVLRLQSTPLTRDVWPHDFAAELRVRLSDTLSVQLGVTNTGAEAFDFTVALHTYLRVSDVGAVLAEGLEGVRFIDKVAGGEPKVEMCSHLRITGEVDRVYLDAPGDVHVRDEAGGGIVVVREGFPDVVVWNPGAEKGNGLSDMGADEYRRMLCVEAAAAGTPVVLPAGETWTGSTTLHLL
jgi:glucose-6-phosphate 1-epimerase